MHRARARLWLILTLIGIGSCRPEEPGIRYEAVTVIGAADSLFESLGAVALVNDHGSVLARPTALASLPDGSFAIGDASDLNIKIFGSDGRHVETWGRAGLGPGEFRSIGSVSVLGDSLFAYDATRPGISVFRSDGAFLRQILFPITHYRATLIGASQMLLTSRPGQGRPLLAIGTTDGTVVHEFLSPEWLHERPGIGLHSGLYADARDGYVHAMLFGWDLLHTFDYEGRLLATRRIPGIGSLVDAWIAAGEAPQTSSGDWFHHGLYAVMHLTALPSGAALIVMAEYDTRQGTDLIEGVHGLVIPPPGRPARAYEVGFSGLPLGWTADADLVVVGYEDYLAGTYRLEKFRYLGHP